MEFPSYMFIFLSIEKLTTWTLLILNWISSFNCCPYSRTSGCYNIVSNYTIKHTIPHFLQQSLFFIVFLHIGLLFICNMFSLLVSYINNSLKSETYALSFGILIPKYPPQPPAAAAAINIKIIISILFLLFMFVLSNLTDDLSYPSL